jgi:RimJ/RimL family protein N-acetyltransferase
VTAPPRFSAAPPLETERLRLCPFMPADADDLFRVYSDPLVMRYISRGVRSREETITALADQIEHWRQHGFGMWALREKRSDDFIGRCGLRVLDRTQEVEVGYTLARSAWGKGYATEAARQALSFGFEEAGLERIVAVAQPENVASRHVMEKLGMRFEKDAYFYDSIVVYYAIDRETFARRVS